MRGREREGGGAAGDARLRTPAPVESSLELIVAGGVAGEVDLDDSVVDDLQVVHLAALDDDGEEFLHIDLSTEARLHIHHESGADKEGESEMQLPIRRHVAADPRTTFACTSSTTSASSSTFVLRLRYMWTAI